MKNEATPATFTVYPWESITESSEHETIAVNIMKILKRTGDVWRRLTWEEYKAERKKDFKTDVSYFSDAEKQYFDRVIGYTESESGARSFSGSWGEL